MSSHIQRIILCLSNIRDTFNARYVLEKNRKHLEKKGYYNFSELDNSICSYVKSTIEEDIIHEVTGRLAEHTSEAHTLVIFCSTFTNNIHLLENTLQQLKNFFPKAEISAFYAVAPQSYVRRALLFWKSMYGNILSGVQNTPYQLAAATNSAIKKLQSLLTPENLHIYPHDGHENAEIEALKAFYAFANIPCTCKLFLDYNVPTECVFLAQALSNGIRFPDLFISEQLENLMHSHANGNEKFKLFSCKSHAEQFRHLSIKNSEEIKQIISLPARWVYDISQDDFYDNDIFVDETSIEKTCNSMDKELCQQLWKQLSARKTQDLTLSDRFILKACALRLNKTEPKMPWDGAVISVVTPTYNHKDFIAQNIESIAAQQLSVPFVHIIADDGSQDGTQEIILEYAKKFRHIIPLFRNSVRSSAHNHLNAFFHARTPFVALCDGDDYMTDPYKLQKQYDFLCEHPQCSMCFHPVQIVYENSSQPVRQYPTPEQLPRGIRKTYYLADLLKKNFIQTNSVMYRWRFEKGLTSSFTTSVQPADWYWHILHAELGSIGFINETMAVYRRHAKALFYDTENTNSYEKHRLKHGIYELEMYFRLNAHFDDNYLRHFEPLVFGVLGDFLRYYQKSGDDTLLQQAINRYPAFGQRFLEYLVEAKKVIFQ